MIERLRDATWLVIVFTAVLILGACEEEVAAPSGLDKSFSMYGIINPRRSMQTVLVSTVERFLSDYAPSIDATVRSTDLKTNETITWRDSVVASERARLIMSSLPTSARASVARTVSKCPDQTVP